MSNNPPKHIWVNSLLSWYEKEQRDFPWRREVNVYHTWVCEVMSQQTTLGAVLPKYREFLKALPTVQHLAQCHESQLRQLWSGLGYYARARNLQKGAQYIMDECAGTFPSTYEGWLAVPGCGPYSASVISSICFSCAAACVDGNVVRVVSRLLALRDNVWESSGQSRIRDFVSEAIPVHAPGNFNQAMMELGATVCKKQNPTCTVCPLEKGCEALAQNSVADCPPAKPRRAFVDETVYAFVLRDPSKKRVALLQRGKGFLAQTVGFPLLKGSSAKNRDSLAWARQSKVVTLSESSKTISHTITHHRIKGVVLAADLSVQQSEHRTWIEALAGRMNALSPVDWLPENEVSSHLSSALDKKLWQLFAEMSGRQNP